ncbi:unnamed protein product [Rotaria sp. Silwood1]|nr:unnamed protein product [Rotaria sp. Silwood1]CAF1346750.1 unnamed protein product [Rotaria sp. Silwood1]CAF3548090.1 unnamed protein product [Rotaria sp. Silwood1]CAF3569674.1 unnamed protein product [Rotaria sp. Silwood1]CAF4630158.1 unnamed protein product [Rotaria sp. Silwood1]
MNQTKDLSQRHEEERQIIMNDNKEKFLYEHKDQSKVLKSKKFHGIIRTYMENGNQTITQNNYKYDSTTSSEQSLTHKFVRYSNIHQNSQENTYPQHNRQYETKLSSFHIEPKIIYDEIWLSNKQYNTRVTSYIDNKQEKFLNKNNLTSYKRKSSRTCTYQVSNGQVVHERIYPATIKTKLCLRVAVNGASKSMRGQLPLSNLNLTNGDFGDDAGMIVENRDYCFVGLADGASGNRSFGINPADFSQAILAACRNILHQSNIQPHQLPRLILSAIQQVEASRVRGSSTLCLFALDKQENTLTSLNIGDSGFVIYRNNEIYCRSKCTMNSNGFGPRQLFSVNDSLGLPCFINENEVLRDCSLDTVEVQKDDMIILSSDGLWDVIKNDQLHQIVKRNTNKHIQDLADDLLSQAVEGYIANGRDDILVIVCRVDSL